MTREQMIDKIVRGLIRRPWSSCYVGLMPYYVAVIQLQYRQMLAVEIRDAETNV